MNERIKELAEQANTTADNRYAAIVPLPNWDEYEQIWLQDYDEKFAELIVEECMNATRGASTGLDAFNNIKEHFGVK